jgi:hypothetical protein
MSWYKGKDIEFRREPLCGCMIKRYPLKAENDLLEYLVVKRTSDMDEKWSFQTHKHKDFEEYWFVIEGKGQIVCGEEIYDVEKGDLVVTPRGVPHKARGDMTFLCIMAKHNVYGMTLGTRLQYEAVEEPYRDNPEEVPKVGQYIEKDTVEEGQSEG